MKQIVTKGIVLTRTNFGEADRIITVLSSDQGKIRLLAKGVRKIKSRMAGGIELFSINDLTYILGKSDLNTLVSSRLVTNYGQIVKDVERTMYAYEVIKLVNKITEDSPEIEYYELLKVTLSAINKSEIDLGYIRLWLQLRLLKLSGHSPNLLTNSQGVALNSGLNYSFSFDEMCFSEHTSGPYSAQYIKFLRLASSASTPEKLLYITEGDTLLQPLVQLTKTMLGLHANTITGY